MGLDISSTIGGYQLLLTSKLNENDIEILSFNIPYVRISVTKHLL